MNRYLTSVKREFWEYRGTFTLLPAIAAAAVSVLMIGALIVYATNLFNVQIDSKGLRIDPFLNGSVNISIDADEDYSHHDQAMLLRVLTSLLEAKADLESAQVDVNSDEIQKDLAQARKEITDAQRELEAAGIAVDLEKMMPDIDHKAIKAIAQKEIDRELAKINSHIIRIEQQLKTQNPTVLMPVPPLPPLSTVAPATAVDPVAPAAPAAPVTISDQLPQGESTDEGEFRDFPSQVIVIEKSDAPNFTHDNIAMADKVIKIFFIFFSGMMLIVGFYYLLSCLYTDRKDNSILFWKSLPVSETQNVLSKLAVATIALPLIGIAAALLVSIVYMLLGMIFVASYSSHTTAWELFSGLHVFSFAVQHFVMALGAILWSLPIFAWLMLASAAARRSPFMFALIPPVVIAIAEKVFFGSTLFVDMLDRRLIAIGVEGDSPSFVGAGMNSFGQFISAPGLWLGFLVAAAFIAAAIWLRNNRYEV